MFPATISDAKLVSWNRVVPKSVFRLEKDSRAGIVLDRDGRPHLFIFNTAALLDVLSEIDDKLVDRLPSKEYHSKTANPAGWLIDEIESKLPISDRYVTSLKAALKEAKIKGWIPFQKIERELELA